MALFLRPVFSEAIGWYCAIFQDGVQNNANFRISFDIAGYRLMDFPKLS